MSSDALKCFKGIDIRAKFKVQRIYASLNLQDNVNIFCKVIHHFIIAEFLVTFSIIMEYILCLFKNILLFLLGHGDLTLYCFLKFYSCAFHQS